MDDDVGPGLGQGQRHAAPKTFGRPRDQRRATFHRKFHVNTIIAMRSTSCKFVLAMMLTAAGGCAEPCGPIFVDTGGVEPAVDYRLLANVLAECVQPNGLADRDALPQWAETLDRQIAILAVTGPTATPQLLPTRQDVLAYWYNAHAAWSMKLLLARGCPRLIAARAMLDRAFPLDGRTMTLREIEHLLAAEGDFRVAAAVPGATTCHARLPVEPIPAEEFDRTAARRFEELLADELRLYIDVRRRQVLIPPVLWQFRERLIGEHNRLNGTTGATLITALSAMTTGRAHRRLQAATGYEEVEAVCRELLTDEAPDKPSP
jgi:hypothetical protein